MQIAEAKNSKLQKRDNISRNAAKIIAIIAKLSNFFIFFTFNFFHFL